ncbi:MAG: arginase family protein, partial [Candidatus Woesearchaeota archaeon]
ANLEYYDEEFIVEPYLQGIETLPAVNSLDELKKTSIISKKSTLQKDSFIIAIGGDHSISIPIINSLSDDVSIIIFDAHPDMFHSWNNSTENHRCVAQRASSKHKVLIAGIRSMDKDEEEIIKNNSNVSIIKMHEFFIDDFKSKLNNLANKVYISIDVDAFDSSLIRNTGTPEPGGLSWNEMINLLKIIFSEKQVIGADIVEFAPNKNDPGTRAEAYCLAKLCHKIMAMKAKYNKLASTNP